MRSSSASSAYWALCSETMSASGHEAAGEPMLVGVPGQLSATGANGITPPYSPITDARRSGATANGPK